MKVSVSLCCALSLALFAAVGCSTKSGSAGASQNTSTSAMSGDPYDMPTPAGGGGGSGSGELRDTTINQPVDTANMTTETYTVQSGDSLWKIARQRDTSVATLKALNSMTSDTLRVGQTIKVPAGN